MVDIKPLLCLASKELQETIRSLMERDDWDKVIAEPLETIKKDSLRLFEQVEFSALHFDADQVAMTLRELGFSLETFFKGSRYAEPVSFIKEGTRKLAYEGARLKLARKLLEYLPDLMKEGRYRDAFLILWSALLVTELEEDAAEIPFLIQMFVGGWKDWLKKEADLSDRFLAEMESRGKEVPDYDSEEFLGWFHQEMSDPFFREKAEQWLLSQAGKGSMSEKIMEEMEIESVKLLEQEDFGFLYFKPEEIRVETDEAIRRISKILAEAGPDVELREIKDVMGIILSDIAAKRVSKVVTPEIKQRIERGLRNFIETKTPDRKTVRTINDIFRELQDLPVNKNPFLKALLIAGLEERTKTLAKVGGYIFLEALWETND
ncbi:MAG: hypothetical protein AB1797_12430 [bacterium]